MATLGSTTKRGDYPGTCGVLLPNTEAKFVAVEDGRELEQGQTGELCIRGPQVCAGDANFRTTAESKRKLGQFFAEPELPKVQCEIVVSSILLSFFSAIVQPKIKGCYEFGTLVASMQLHKIHSIFGTNSKFGVRVAFALGKKCI